MSEFAMHRHKLSYLLSPYSFLFKSATRPFSISPLLQPSSYRTEDKERGQREDNILRQFKIRGKINVRHQTYIHANNLFLFMCFTFTHFTSVIFKMWAWPIEALLKFLWQVWKYPKKCHSEQPFGWLVWVRKLYTQLLSGCTVQYSTSTLLLIWKYFPTQEIMSNGGNRRNSFSQRIGACTWWQTEAISESVWPKKPDILIGYILIWMAISWSYLKMIESPLTELHW